MTASLLFDPILPWPVLAALAAIALLALGLAIRFGLRGWPLRALAALVILATLSGPQYQIEDRSPLSDIVILVDDQSASQHLAERRTQTKAALETLEQALNERPNTETRLVSVPDGADNSGTALMGALTEALAQEPRARIAGIIALSDGQVHDAASVPDLPAPLHLLMSGRSTDWDRRLIVRNAPAFAIIGEPVTLRLRIEDSGAAPAANARVPLQIAVDGAAPQTFQIPVGEDIELPVTLPHGGRNVLQFTTPAAPDELTDRNNTALIQINGVRDRLRVLLVSGEPHPGGRTWRNLLKSDSSVDLVHFTILRPPEKQDGVPVNELSLIAFPTRELFLEKIDDFDLIIFDRYKRRGILPAIYLDNVVDYVRKGGAVLVAAGPDFASADSIFRSPLGPILPAEPTARILEQRFAPTVTEPGQRHPVTANLETDWGDWLRQIEVEATAGTTLMEGIDTRPLLVLNRVEEGRVALLSSDHAWLWSRGFDGGGPQLELLRRLAHWMMKEPELEEETLWAEATGQQIRIIRRTLKETTEPVTITTPSGDSVTVSLSETEPGRFEALYTGPEIGLYRLTQEDHQAVIGLGPAAPREFEHTIATPDILAPIIAAQRGALWPLENGTPKIRDIRAGRPAAGRGWIGLTPRNAFETRSISQTPLLPPWLILLLATALIVGGWMREGRS